MQATAIFGLFISPAKAVLRKASIKMFDINNLHNSSTSLLKAVRFGGIHITLGVAISPVVSTGGTFAVDSTIHTPR